MPKKSSVVSTTSTVETPVVASSNSTTEQAKKKKVAVRKSVKKTAPKVEAVEPEPVVEQVQEPVVETVQKEKVDTLIEENSETLPEEPRRTKRVVNKFKVQLPSSFIGVLSCPNSNCISHNEPVKTQFYVNSRAELKLKCHYCEKTFNSSFFNELDY